MREDTDFNYLKDIWRMAFSLSNILSNSFLILALKDYFGSSLSLILFDIYLPDQQQTKSITKNVQIFREETLQGVTGQVLVMPKLQELSKKMIAFKNDEPNECTHKRKKTIKIKKILICLLKVPLVETTPSVVLIVHHRFECLWIFWGCTCK